MSVNQRIEELINFLHLNPNSFSKAIGMANNVTISKITRGKGAPSYSTLERIKAAFPEVNMDWIITGNGEMILKNDKSHDERIKELEKEVEFWKDFAVTMKRALKTEQDSED